MKSALPAPIRSPSLPRPARRPSKLLAGLKQDDDSFPVQTGALHCDGSVHGKAGRANARRGNYPAVFGKIAGRGRLCGALRRRRGNTSEGGWPSTHAGNRQERQISTLSATSASNRCGAGRPHCWPCALPSAHVQGRRWHWCRSLSRDELMRALHIQRGAGSSRADISTQPGFCWTKIRRAVSSEVA